MTTIDWHHGPRSELRPLFQLAEDSDAQLDSYLELGRILVAKHGDEIVGHLQLVETEEPGAVEIKNMAVAQTHQGSGLGRSLIERAVDEARRDGRARVVVSTAAASTGNLRFYQRCGFRMLSIDRDAFTAETGYPVPILIDGVPLRDRVWLSLELEVAGPT